MQIDDFLDLVHSRRSIRTFKPDPVPKETLENPCLKVKHRLTRI